MTIQWVLVDAIIELHQQQIKAHGGAEGVRDRGALESALARPAHLRVYGTPDLADLAAALALGIVRNHPFIDGNKRVSFLSSVIFLRLNGCDLARGDYHQTWFDLAAGKVSELELAAWFRERIAHA